MRFSSFSSASLVRFFLLLLVLLSGVRARADVILLIEDPINFLGHVSSTDHRYEGKTAVQIDEDFFFRADGSVEVAGGAEE